MLEAANQMEKRLTTARIAIKPSNHRIAVISI
jgi:hypothetical protein